MIHRTILLGILVGLAACFGDPVGLNGVLAVRQLTGPQDSVLTGSPGRALAAPLGFEAVDGNGNPVARATVEWTVVGTNGRLEQAAAVTDAQGRFGANWVLGTKASERQRLTIQVRADKQTALAVITAVARPVEVSSIAFVDDTTTIKLGVATALAVQATDPFGNTFVPSGARYTCLDSALCTIDSLGIVQPLKRGWGRVVVVAGSVADTASVHSTQVVQTITTSSNTLRFHSLGQTANLVVQLIDDHGLLIKDSLPTDSVLVDSVARVQAGPTYAVQSVSNGYTSVVLRAGVAAHSVRVVVNQKVSSVRLSASRTQLDALSDTVQLMPAVSDSVGAALPGEPLEYSAVDTSIVTVAPSGLVTSKGNGSTWVRAMASNGIADSVWMVVAQRVARIQAKRDSMLLGALHAVLSIDAVPVDRLGSPVTTAILSYGTTAQSVATVDSTGNVRANSNGSALVTASFGAETASVVVRVAQRPVRVLVSKDTVTFAALGDTQTVAGVAVDSLGSPVSGGVTSVLAADTAVVQVVDSTLHARGNGVTSANLTVAGLTRQVVVIVNQVPTTLTAAVAFGNPVVTLPAGASFPLACQALDKNGFAIPRDVGLVGSAHGTVVGSGCADARVARSGYDTLVFALGSAQARVPVIVSTTPDSVGIVTAAQPLTTDQNIRYVGQDLASPSILALHPLVADILAAYGNPTSSLGRARAIRDWVARTALYSDPGAHPDNSTSNLSVLPLGKTWADVNAVLSDSQRARDVAYWADIAADGYAVLDRLLGTLDPATGLRADDGLMVHVAGAQYHMRDIESYHFFLCTYASVLANTLWAAADLQGLLLQVNGHDPAAVFIPELGRWVYEDASYNNDYLLDGIGDPLSPTDLLTLSTNGMASRALPMRLPGPSYDPEVYTQHETYISAVNPQGFLVVGSRMYLYNVPNPTPWGRIVMIDVPALANSPFNPAWVYPRVTAEEAFPTLGVVVQQLQVQDSVHLVQLSSTVPNHDHFERRVSGGGWTRVADVDVLPVGQCLVEYRSMDGRGNSGASAVLDVWIPRADGFIASGAPGAVRAQAQFVVAGF